MENTAIGQWQIRQLLMLVVRSTRTGCSNYKNASGGEVVRNESSALGLVALLAFFVASPAMSAVTVYSDRATWVAAVGAASDRQDFEGFADLTSFVSPDSVSGHGVSLQLTGPGPNEIANVIRYLDGHSLVAVVDLVAPGNFLGLLPNSLIIEFDRPVASFGADFFGLANNEQSGYPTVRVVFYGLNGGEIDYVILDSVVTTQWDAEAFYGFYLDGAQIKRVSIELLDRAVSHRSNDIFLIDNFDTVTGPATNYGLFIGADDPPWYRLFGRFSRNAQAMANAFDARPNTNVSVITGDLTANASGSASAPITLVQIDDRLRVIRSQMRQGDTFTLYINNHGGSFTRDASGNLTVNSTGMGDEFIRVGEDLNDNALSQLLRQFDGFSVTVFLDSCHGGGFWGGSDSYEHTPLGQGFNDLNQLRRIALYSGAAEDKLEYGFASSWSFWGIALKEAFETPMSWTARGLADFLAQRTMQLAAASLQETPVWYSLELGDPVQADLSLIQPYQGNSADYDMDGLHLSAPDPTAQISDLLADVSGVGPGSSLANKVTMAQVYFEANDIGATCAVLTGFVREVKAQTGKKISEADAQVFTASARFTMASIGCN